MRRRPAAIFANQPPDINNMKRTLTIALASIAANAALAATHTVASPDGSLTATVCTDNRLTISISRMGDVLMRPSPIGLRLSDGTEIGRQPRGSATRVKTIKEEIDAPHYRQSHFGMEWRQIVVRLSDGFNLTLRVCDEGVAYRFSSTRRGVTTIASEIGDFEFAPGSTAWMAHTTTPDNPFAMAFQNTYAVCALDTAPPTPAFLPLTVDCGPAKLTVAESDVASYPNLWMRAEGGKLRALHAPRPAKMGRHPWRGMTHVAEASDHIAASRGPRDYPWRVFAVAADDAQMPTNNMVYALARPNKIGDTGWVRPGKAAWEWWNDWNLRGVDFEAGINFETYKYYVDFAARYGLEYVVVDEGWYDSDKGDIMHPRAELQLPELIAYARKQGVGVILWTVFNVVDENLEAACSHYAAMGASGFKVDFLDRDDQAAVEMVERLAECAARHHLVLDLHGIYKPSGLERTYPNILNYESVFGMEECRWTDMSHDMPLYDVTFPFIRMMAGPVDFTPGAMRNGTRHDWRAIYTKPVSMGTRCHQAACYVVHDSPLTMLADSPTSYEADSAYTRFISSLPTTFDKTTVPMGKIGQYIVTARRSGETWYVGGQTNWDGRRLDLRLDFLPAGTEYEAQTLRDGTNANRDAEDYRIETSTVDSSTTMGIDMASGGGFVIKLTPKNQTH